MLGPGELADCERSASRPTPGVSVVLPYRDAAASLEACLHSIAAQSLEDFEILCVDDGSTDDGPRILAAAARYDARIRCLRSGRRGLVLALNLGLSRARADLVARMDADDLMHPDRLQRQRQFLLEHSRVSLVASRVDAFPEHALGPGMRHYLQWQDRCMSPCAIGENIYVESPFVHPSVMFRRQHVLRIGGYRHGMFPEDYELWLRMARAGLHMAKLPRRLLRWRQNPASLSRRDPRYARAAFDMLRARYLAGDARLRQGRELVIWGAGRRTRRRVDRLLAHGYRPKAFIDIDPRKLGRRIQGVPVHPPAWLAQHVSRPLVLGYVANHGAREAIRDSLLEMGYRAGSDFLMVG